MLKHSLAKVEAKPCTRLVSSLLRNHKQISPDQVVPQSFPLWNGALPISGYTWGKQLLLPGWDNLKCPISAPAGTLSQQPHTSLSGKN
ncbi:hypothetical protein T4B_25 [Trichinella pseudospiralis]|uniref:Uncharacterized protein n=1 Tax=Trichinella pseudospiralis TaxID=6337 RepID=A0A0V1H336_TRIPS|nr:hypothetical protein T4B_4844 [Trichinella pseudospiralis]KRZ05171.1 hypothetical protein T4B_25 [Trichinella pseudospiralis]